MHLDAIRKVNQYKQSIIGHLSIRRAAWPAGYHRLIPAMSPDGTGGTVRTRDSGHEGGRCQGQSPSPYCITPRHLKCKTFFEFLIGELKNVTLSRTKTLLRLLFILPEGYGTGLIAENFINQSVLHCTTVCKFNERKGHLNEQITKEKRGIGVSQVRGERIF